MGRVDERVLVGVVVPSACDWSPNPLPEDLQRLRPHCCSFPFKRLRSDSFKRNGRADTQPTRRSESRAGLCFQTVAWKSPPQPSFPAAIPTSWGTASVLQRGLDYISLKPAAVLLRGFGKKGFMECTTMIGHHRFHPFLGGKRVLERYFFRPLRIYISLPFVLKRMLLGKETRND